jgi:hypothetical protein
MRFGPWFGLRMRGREFIMKDSYSFWRRWGFESQRNLYARMHEAYCNIFSRSGLEFRAVDADSGAIGGLAPRNLWCWLKRVKTGFSIPTMGNMRPECRESDRTSRQAAEIPRNILTYENAKPLTNAIVSM